MLLLCGWQQLSSSMLLGPCLLCRASMPGGEVKVLLFNHGYDDYKTEKGDCKAQLSIAIISYLRFAAAGPRPVLLLFFLPRGWEEEAGCACLSAARLGLAAACCCFAARCTA